MHKILTSELKFQFYVVVYTSFVFFRYFLSDFFKCDLFGCFFLFSTRYKNTNHVTLCDPKTIRICYGSVRVCSAKYCRSCNNDIQEKKNSEKANDWFERAVRECNVRVPSLHLIAFDHCIGR